MFNYRGQFVSPNTPPRGQLFTNSVILYAYDAADVMDDNNYATVLESFVTTSSLQVAQVHTKKVSGLGHLILAKKWGNSPKKAFNTIQHTTQHGVCTVFHASLSCQFRTNDHQLQYRRLPHYMYSDTLFATTVFRRGNRCAHILATNFGWLCLFPLKLKCEAHEALSLLFQQDWVPPAVICDIAKEMILGEINWKLKDASCHLKQIESFTT